MQNKTSSHVPFAQLSVEARALFFVYASAALARYRCQPPTPEELAPAHELAWNANQLCEGDLSDPNRMTRLLEEYVAPFSSNITGRAGAQRSGRLCRKTSR